MTLPNTTPLNEELDKILIKLHQQFCEYGCSDREIIDEAKEAKQELTKLIQTLEKKARNDLLDNLEEFKAMVLESRPLTVKVPAWIGKNELQEWVDNARQAELGSAKELLPNNTTTRSKE